MIGRNSKLGHLVLRLLVSLSLSLYLLIDFFDIDGHANAKTKNELGKHKISHFEGRWSYSSLSYCHVKGVPRYQCNSSIERLPLNHQGQRQPTKERLQKLCQDHWRIKVDVPHLVPAFKHTPVMNGLWLGVNQIMDTKKHVLKRYSTAWELYLFILDMIVKVNVRSLNDNSIT